MHQVISGGPFQPWPFWDCRILVQVPSPQRHSPNRPLTAPQAWWHVALRELLKCRSWCLHGSGLVPRGNPFLQRPFHRLQGARWLSSIRLSGVTASLSALRAAEACCRGLPLKRLCLRRSELPLLAGNVRWSFTSCKAPVPIWSHLKLLKHLVGKV